MAVAKQARGASRSEPAALSKRTATAASQHSNKRKAPSDEKHKGLDKSAGSATVSSEPTRKSARTAQHIPCAPAQRRPPKTSELAAFAEAADLCCPDDESQYLKTHPGAKTYSHSVLSPFEELLSAIIISRPISHRLGLRTVRTVLNAPYGFVSARATRDAGSDKQRQALWDAKTQHKEKTAAQIGMLADLVIDQHAGKDDPDGETLAHVLGSAGGDVDGALDALRRDVKGLGRTSLAIFKRRVQWQWHDAHPFVDERSGDGLKALGLPVQAQDLARLLNKHWAQLNTKHLAGDDEEARQRRALVAILDRATAAQLEGKLDVVAGMI